MFVILPQQPHPRGWRAASFPLGGLGALGAMGLLLAPPARTLSTDRGGFLIRELRVGAATPCYLQGSRGRRQIGGQHRCHQRWGCWTLIGGFFFSGRILSQSSNFRHRCPVCWILGRSPTFPNRGRLLCLSRHGEGLLCSRWGFSLAVSACREMAARPCLRFFPNL